MTEYRVEHSWRAKETSDGCYQPQVGYRRTTKIETTWHNVGVRMRDQFAAEDFAKAAAERIAHNRVT